jgi:hypothetical protein
MSNVETLDLAERLTVAINRLDCLSEKRLNTGAQYRKRFGRASGSPCFAMKE